MVIEFLRKMNVKISADALQTNFESNTSSQANIEDQKKGNTFEIIDEEEEAEVRAMIIPSDMDFQRLNTNIHVVPKAICADNPESIRQMSYEALYQYPTSLFPNWPFTSDSSGCMQEYANRLKYEQLVLRKNLTRLRWISLEIEEVLRGDHRGFTNLALLINSTIPKYVLIGSQSSGKSQILNIIATLTLTPNNIHIALRNKSPIIFKLRPVREVSQQFSINGVTIPYDNLLTSLAEKFNEQLDLNEKEIVVEVNASFILYPMDFVTLPEYTVSKRAEVNKISQIIRKYLHDQSCA